MFPYFLTWILGDDEHAYFYVCQDHAKSLQLTTDDSCVGGCECQILGCHNETSLVHYLWDFRSEIVEQRKVDQEPRPQG